MSIKDDRMEGIETAVVPAAGYGSRMKPLTPFVPKEMLPLGLLPVIEHTIAELVSSGIKRICVVIRKEKEVIREYLDSRRSLYEGVKLEFVYQKAPFGLGDALRTAKDFLDRTPFVMAIPDQILLSEHLATYQLLEACKSGYGIWNSMVKIPKKESRFFEGARSFKYQKAERNIYVLKGFSQDKSSLIRGFGRTVFLSEALDYMTEEYLNDQTGEVDFLKTYEAIQGRFPLYGTILKGVPCDLGTWEGYSHYLPAVLRFMKQEDGL